VLGTIRTLWVTPRFGARMAELMEMPLMLVVTIPSCSAKDAASISSSSHEEKRHDGEHPEHHVINGSRHRVSGSKILLDRQARKPEHEPEFRDQQESKSEATHPQPGRQHGRHSQTQNYPPRCDSGMLTIALQWQLGKFHWRDLLICTR
jgi:hypothetical protein